jgi:peptidyl-dipeptidase Dcp
LFSASSYAAAYYVYLWAEVLDAGKAQITSFSTLQSGHYSYGYIISLSIVLDGFDAFLEAGSPFDKETARKVRKYIYSSGASMDPREAYRAFRGRDPKVEAMLRKKGLLVV